MIEPSQKTALKVQLRPSGLGLKVALTLLIVFAIGALGAVYLVHRGIQKQTELLRQEAAAVAYANSQLESRTASPDSVQSIRRVAQEELGLVNPKTIIFEPNP